MTEFAFLALGVAAVGGAVFAVTARDLLRAVGGLGVFLLALAGLFSVFGAGFLALAELFLYVGGVLVLLLFAIMLTRRSAVGRPDLRTRMSAPAVIAPLALTFALVSVFAPSSSVVRIAASLAGPDSTATVLLGPLLPAFEVAGLVLLIALVAVIAVMGGERE